MEDENTINEQQFLELIACQRTGSLALFYLSMCSSFIRTSFGRSQDAPHYTFQSGIVLWKSRHMHFGRSTTQVGVRPCKPRKHLMTRPPGNPKLRSHEQCVSPKRS